MQWESLRYPGEEKEPADLHPGKCHLIVNQDARYFIQRTFPPSFPFAEEVRSHFRPASLTYTIQWSGLKRRCFQGRLGLSRSREWRRDMR